MRTPKEETLKVKVDTFEDASARKIEIPESANEREDMVDLGFTAIPMMDFKSTQTETIKISNPSARRNSRVFINATNDSNDSATTNKSIVIEKKKEKPKASTFKKPSTLKILPMPQANSRPHLKNKSSLGKSSIKTKAKSKKSTNTMSVPLLPLKSEQQDDVVAETDEPEEINVVDTDKDNVGGQPNIDSTRKEFNLEISFNSDDDEDLNMNDSASTAKINQEEQEFEDDNPYADSKAVPPKDNANKIKSSKKSAKQLTKFLPFNFHKAQEYKNITSLFEERIPDVCF